MIQSVSEFRRLLFELNPEVDEFVIQVDELVEQLPDEVASDVFPVVFSFFENFADSYCGAPGTLVHLVEDYFPNYVDSLFQSIRRRPACNTTIMLNRILNSDLAESQRSEMLDLLKSISTNPAASDFVRDQANDFVKHQLSKES